MKRPLAILLALQFLPLVTPSGNAQTTGEESSSAAETTDLPLTEVTGAAAAPRSAPAPVEAPSPPPVEVVEEPVVEEASAVTLELADDYEADFSTTATKTNAPISETPVSVQTVPRQVLEDQAATEFDDIFRNVSGVVEAGNTLNASSVQFPVIRGFESQVVLRNGMRASTFGAGLGAVDLVNVESVEVLKGPASILYGNLAPGGVLNFNTKKPLAETRYDLNQQFGSDDHFRSTLDLTGPLNADRTLLYRLNGAYMNSGSFRDHVDTERSAIAPSFLFRPTEDTEWLFDFSYSIEDSAYDSGVPFGLDGDPLVPISSFFGDPTLDGRHLEDLSASTQFTHRFDEVFTLRAGFQYHRSDAENEALRSRGVVGVPGAEELRLRYQNEDRVTEESQFNIDLIAEFDTGALEHEVLVGTDYVHQDSDFLRFRQSLPSVPIVSRPFIRFNPPAFQPQQTNFPEAEWFGLYAQDQVSLLDDRLHLLFGGRYDDFHSESVSDGIPTPEIDESEFTGRFGALYEVNDWLSPYASVSQSFQPQFASFVDRDGNPLAPETGIQYEAGVKSKFFGDRLLFTASLYQIDKEDVAVFDQVFFNDTGELTFFPGVEERSRGVEFDLTGQLTEETRIIANYAYTDTETAKNDGDPSVVGHRLGGVPLHAARVWLAHDFREGSALDGFGFGIGVRHESERLAQFDTTLALDDYTVVDAGVWYRRPLASGQTFKAQLNFRNLFDKEYYPRASDRSIVHPGEPFGVIGSVGLEF